MVAILQRTCVDERTDTGTQSEKGILLKRHIWTVRVDQALQKDAILRCQGQIQF